MGGDVREASPDEAAAKGGVSMGWCFQLLDARLNVRSGKRCLAQGV